MEENGQLIQESRDEFVQLFGISPDAPKQEQINNINNHLEQKRKMLEANP